MLNRNDKIKILDDKTALGLDPVDWPSTRAQAHRMLDDILDYVATIRERPVWTPIPAAVRSTFTEASPEAPTDLAEVHGQFLRKVLPYALGNCHPRFMGWVHGGGNVAGLLGEMLAAGLNANLGGRDHQPIEVERQVLRWVRGWFGWPDEAEGLFVTGTSMAHFMAVLVARTETLGTSVRAKGLQGMSDHLRAYTAQSAHASLVKAMEMSGLGREALRRLPVGPDGCLDLTTLKRAIASDRKEGLLPFLVIGTAGTVDTGAVDDLSGIALIAEREGLWFHVDGAYGALGILSPILAPLLGGIQKADSVALDFHKWGQVPYDAGFLVVRKGALLQSTFASPAAYLHSESRGLAGGAPWPCDMGPDLSRGFRALKTWFTLKVHGTRRLGEVFLHTCQLARHLKALVEARGELELMAPVTLNIVCFRHRGEDADALNRWIVLELQESGIAAPSTTVLDGRVAIRAAIVNHRTRLEDIEVLVAAVLDLGCQGLAAGPGARP